MGSSDDSDPEDDEEEGEEEQEELKATTNKPDEFLCKREATFISILQKSFK